MQIVRLIVLFYCLLLSQHLWAQSTLKVQQILISGNQQTQNFIIEKELLFAEKQTYVAHELDSLMQRTKENLLNTSLFNYVYINKKQLDEHTVSVYVTVEERWYLWPRLVLAQGHHNFSSWIKNRDWDLVYYGFTLNKYNFRGRKETIGVQFIWGFLHNVGFFYHDFYLGKQRKHAFDFAYQFTAQKKVAYNTFDNQLLYVSLTQNTILKKHEAQLNYSYRPQTDHRFEVQSNWYRYQISDTIEALNANYLGLNTNLMQVFKTSVSHFFSTHNYNYYPQTGSSSELTLSNTSTIDGLHTLKNQALWVGRKYVPVSPKWIWANALEIQLSSPKHKPYILDRAIGYWHNVRGYENYVINGDDFAIWHHEWKYKLLTNQVSQMQAIANEKFNKVYYSYFLNLFSDIAYVHDAQFLNNPLANRALYSIGVGLDFVTYYDKILRLQFSINHQKKTAFALQFQKAF